MSEFTIEAAKPFLTKGTRVTVFGDAGTVKKGWRDSDGVFYSVEMDHLKGFDESRIEVRACNVKEIV